MTTAASPSPGPPAALSHRQVMVAFSGLLLAMLLGSLDQTIVATALPTIVGQLGGLDQLSWVVTAYLLAATVSMPLWGRISDLYGRKRLFQAAIVVFLAGSVASGAAATIGELIGFRALQGLGGGGLMTLAMAIVADIIPPASAGATRATSRWSSCSPRSPGRCSAGCSSTTSRGAGSSTSTCRSGRWPWW